MYGFSIGWAPAHVNIIKVLIKNQKRNWLKGKYLEERNLNEYRGRKYKIIIENNRAITPPNLLGIDRRIA